MFNKSNAVVRRDTSLVPQYNIDPAVEFGNLSRGDNPKAFPFFYGFTAYPNQAGILDETTGNYTLNATQAEGPDGLDILAFNNFSNLPGLLTIPIILDDDCNFHLLYIKFGAHRVKEFTTVATTGANTIAMAYVLGVVDNPLNGFGIVFTVTGNTNLALGQQYYVVNTSYPNTFQVALTPGGSAVAFTGTGNVTYQIQTGPNIQPSCGAREYLINSAGGNALGGNYLIKGSSTVAATVATSLFAQPAVLEVNGNQIFFSVLNTVTGVATNFPYYVINATATTFQLTSTTSNTGAAITLGGANASVTYTSYTNSNNGLLLAGRNTRIPYWTDLDVSVFMTSSGGRGIMGQFQRHPLTGIPDVQPIPCLDVCGTSDGLGMIKVPYQLTKNATVTLRFTSRSPFPLRVYGHLFGYKISV